MNVSDFVVEQLHSMGVRRAFGIVGGGIAYFYNSIIKSAIKLHQFRHESGAGFAATEAYFSEGKPTVVFTTTGPGLLNALTGICAAKWEGAKVVMLSAASSPDQRGKWPIQETSHFTYPCSGLLSGGVLFDLSVQVESPEELAVIFHRLAAGLSGPGGFIARISLPTSIQTASIEVDSMQWQQDYGPAPVICASASMIEQCAARLRDETFAIWLGYGAVNDTELCIRLARMTGARVFSSCRAKGIFPENDPLYLGVTGIGGHESVIDYMVNERPDWVLVLGSRLGEATSFWDHRMLPSQGFIQVDIDREVLGSAFPQCQTVAIQSEIALFLQMLMDRLEPSWFESRKIASVTNYTMVNTARSSSPEASASPARVSPLRLMSTIQKEIVDGSDALIMSECGNAFLWMNHHLRFSEPRRYRTSSFFGAMGHFSAGVVGAALVLQKKTVAVVGDGSFLMHNEVTTAVKYKVPVVWIVLNDAGYGICRSGFSQLGLIDEEMDFDEVDFVAMARAQGGNGLTITGADSISDSIKEAMRAKEPFVLDVKIDLAMSPSLSSRIESLRKAES